MNGVSVAGSWPLTWWPISARRVATALIPAPPTLVTWIRRGDERSKVRAATSVLLSQLRDPRRCVGPCPGPPRTAHGPEALLVIQQPVDLRSAPPAVHATARPGHRRAPVAEMGRRAPPPT